jgi:hypothetical protein
MEHAARRAAMVVRRESVSVLPIALALFTSGAADARLLALVGICGEPHR